MVAWEHTEESLHRQLRRADAIAAELAGLDATFRAGLSPAEADHAFPARVGPWCGWCDFHRVCGPGRAAVPVKDPWAGVAPD